MIQEIEVIKDKTVRLTGSDHYSLKVMSLNSGLSIKRLITQAVQLLIAERPELVKPRGGSGGGEAWVK